MKKLLFTLATAMMAISAMAFEAPETGYWLVMYDQFNVEYPYQLNPGSDGSWTTTVTLNYYPWGEFYWDQNKSAAENDLNRPNVPFFFVVAGTRLGAPTDLQPTQMGVAAHTMSNPLVETEYMYTVPVGYSYTLGVFVRDILDEQGNKIGEEYYVYCAQGPQTDVEEINASKAVAGVRYFNMAGQEMQEANGMTIVVTTYTDGTTSAAKVVK